MLSVGHRVRVASTAVGRTTHNAWTGVIERASHMRSAGEESTKTLVGKVRKSSNKKAPAPAKAAKATKSVPKAAKATTTAKKATGTTKASVPAKKVAKKPIP
jgi:hypothetical protein